MLLLAMVLSQQYEANNTLNEELRVKIQQLFGLENAFVLSHHL